VLWDVLLVEARGGNHLGSAFEVLLVENIPALLSDTFLEVGVSGQGWDVALIFGNDHIFPLNGRSLERVS